MFLGFQFFTKIIWEFWQAIQYIIELQIRSVYLCCSSQFLRFPDHTFRNYGKRWFLIAYIRRILPESTGSCTFLFYTKIFPKIYTFVDLLHLTKHWAFSVIVLKVMLNTYKYYFQVLRQGLQYSSKIRYNCSIFLH